MENQLIIGNKNYSSWSLHPWLLLRVKNIPFKETLRHLYQDDSTHKLKPFSPTGSVPFFKNSQVRIWESLAICEYIAEAYPEAHCWPDQVQSRSLARSISAEIHAGFPTIRDMLPMNIRDDQYPEMNNRELQIEVHRVNAIWQDCRLNYQSQGDFLFGDFSIADAMYAPLVIRFEHYEVEVGSLALDYMQNILELEPIKQWIAAAKQETI